MPEQPRLGLHFTKPTNCILLELGWSGVLSRSHHLSDNKQPSPPFQDPLLPSLLYVTTGRQQERSQSVSAFLDPISNDKVSTVLIGTIIRKN